MNKVYKLILTLLIGLLIVSCNQNDVSAIAPKKDYAEQYAKDNDSIVKFLQTHYMELVDDESLPNFGDVTFIEIPTGGTQVSVWNETAEHRKLRIRLVEANDITYTVYYINFRDGIGEKPCNVDGVYANYKGTLLNGNVFDQLTNPQALFQLDGVIRGWSEIFPQFASGTYISNSDGTTTFDDFGAGVMFLPSGLGYYNITQATIPAYSPLIFSIKLYEVKRMDQDSDGIPSYLEDLSGPTVVSAPDGYIYVMPEDEVNPDDTDGDDFPDYLDLDDDGDFVLTRTEILQYTDPNTGEKHYYSYDGAATDDPSTPYDETKGIPRAFTGPLMPVIIPPSTTPVMLLSPGPGDFTDPTRLRRHLDPDAKPPYYDQY